VRRLTIIISTVTILVLTGNAGEHTVIDIVHTDLHIYVSFASSSLRGEVHYNAVIQEHQSGMVEFNSYWLHKDSILVNGHPVSPIIPDFPGYESFLIDLPEEYTVGDTILISIYYHRVDEPDAAGREETRAGYYYFPAGTQRWGQTALRTIGYTMSEPNDARAWFPTIDIPSNKSTLTFRITVDQPVTVIANGTKESVEHNEDGSVTYTYVHTYPIPPYLFAFNIGSFNEYPSLYQADDGRTISVASYLFPEDEDNATPANTMMVEMLGLFEGLFGEYPFERYGMIAVEPFLYGGMEHQTITTMRRSLFLNEHVIAHELAHQWWGNMVTCESWSEIWLNEGFASYSEILYDEYRYGEQAAQEALAVFATRYFNEDATERYALYNPPPHKIFGTAIYRKGAWILHMLRSMLGDEIFFTALNEYGEQYRYTTATTETLREVFESISGRSLDWFFDQWVYHAGYPIYSIDAYIPENVGEEPVPVTLTLRQLQTDAPAVFKGYVTFTVMYSHGDTTVTFWNTERNQEFSFEAAGIPETIVFDPYRSILNRFEGVNMVEGPPRSLPESVELYQNYPNPFNTETVIEYALPDREHVRLRITDSLGRIVLAAVDEVRNAGRYSYTFNAGEHAAGVYYAVLETESIRKIRKMIYLR
jgi:aminopeptidase N